MSDISIINLPDFGEFEDVEVIEICAKEGQTVSSEDPVIVLETDKAAMEIPASVSGTVKKVLLKEGDKVKISISELGYIENNVIDEPPSTKTIKF